MLDGTQVLVVEDEPIAAMHLAQLVSGAKGHVIGPAHTVTEARELVRSRKIDVALLDVNLRDGEVVTSVLKR